MAASPDDRRYSKEHEWLKIDGDVAIIGITDYAQDQLGDVVYVDLPPTGTEIKQFEKMGEIESVKAVSDLYSPASGEVVELNQRVVEHPELVNSDAHGDGWGGDDTSLKRTSLNMSDTVTGTMLVSTLCSSVNDTTGWAECVGGIVFTGIP